LKALKHIQQFRAEARSVRGSSRLPSMRPVCEKEKSTRTSTMAQRAFRSILTTERYLGSEQNLKNAVNDALVFE
jgi:hypothetical protein